MPESNVTQAKYTIGEDLVNMVLLFQNGRFKLGAHSQWLDISDITVRRAHDSAFDNFRERLSKFIEGHLGITEIHDYLDENFDFDNAASKKVYSSSVMF